MMPPLRLSDRIRPWMRDPRYWQYRGQPVLLLGGSREDNLFQILDLEEHLDLLAAAGGNVVRNTMSDRDPDDAYPFLRLEDGRYDLEQWNPDYWQRLDRLLHLSRKRDIIVQIEVWDRFDLSDAKGMGNWQRHPYNPVNTVTWTAGETGFAAAYPDHPSKDRHPFYHSIPGMAGYDPRLDRVRRVQEAFVAKLLDHTLPAGNVLYCMDNETSTAPAWGRHWIGFIKMRAERAGVDVSCTDMFDDAFIPEQSANLAGVLDDPATYDFVEISQVNSRNYGADHWRRVRWTTKRAHASGRPVNHTKIYSDGGTPWGSGTPQEGLARFWRNLLAGSASARFHRPTSGLGLSPLAQHCLRSARLVESLVPFWSLRPDDGLLVENDDVAYAATNPTGTAVVYCCRGEDIALARTEAGSCRVTWIAPTVGAAVGTTTLDPCVDPFLHPPLSGPMIAVIQPADR